MSDKVPVVAIDGPAASGKGTLAMELCRQLMWYRLDSGLLYRIVGYMLRENDVSLEDQVALEDFLLDSLTIDVSWEDTTAQNQSAVVSIAVDIEGGEKVRVSGVDVTRTIRSNEIAKLASRVATMEAVRSCLIPVQRSFRHAPGLVADGRDMGTVVFPDAVVKIFLTANLAERARRRQRQLSLDDKSLAKLEDSLRQRDQQDMERELAPLRPALDAIHLDSSELTIDQMTQRAIEICRHHSIA